jgi:hypothetical protein
MSALFEQGDRRVKRRGAGDRGDDKDHGLADELDPAHMARIAAPPGRAVGRALRFAGTITTERGCREAATSSDLNMRAPD